MPGVADTSEYPNDQETRALVSATLAFVDSRTGMNPDDLQAVRLVAAVRDWRKKYPARTTPFPSEGLNVGVAGGSGLR